MGKGTSQGENEQVEHSYINVILNSNLPAIVRDSSLRCILFNLVKSTSSECVSTNKARFPPFPLVVVGKLK